MHTKNTLQRVLSAGFIRYPNLTDPRKLWDEFERKRILGGFFEIVCNWLSQHHRGEKQFVVARRWAWRCDLDGDVHVALVSNYVLCARDWQPETLFSGGSCHNTERKIHFPAVPMLHSTPIQAQKNHPHDNSPLTSSHTQTHGEEMSGDFSLNARWTDWWCWWLAK